MTPPSVTPQDEALLQQVTGLSFPSSTRFLYFEHEQGGMDDAILAKIEVSSEDLADFEKQQPLANAKWSSERNLIDDIPGVETWSPSTMIQYRFCQFDLPGGEALDILIDDLGSSIVTIYVVWFQT